ncbi:MAG: hypothetical protein L0I33_08550, partial [Acetobacter sp.]|nr:hypothetical protein [Acetobacter sp.]
QTVKNHVAIFPYVQRVCLDLCIRWQRLAVGSSLPLCSVLGWGFLVLVLTFMFFVVFGLIWLSCCGPIGRRLCHNWRYSRACKKKRERQNQAVRAKNRTEMHVSSTLKNSTLIT